jgi:MFS family permease
MFNTFPTKPIPHSPLLRQSRQAHRSAIIYEPNLNNTGNKLPARPQPVRTQPERPVPVIQLPGLPPRSLPKSIVKSGPNKNWSEVTKIWLAQFHPFKKFREIAPPINTPRTAKFLDVRKHHKGLADFDDTLEDDLYDLKPTPPPLYVKEPPEGGLVGWLAVAGAFLLQFCTIGYLSTWDVFEAQYNHVTLTDNHPAAVRWIGSFQLFFAFALSLLAGKLTDAGYFNHVIMSGSGLFVTCLLLLSFVAEEQFGLVFLFQGIGMGTGMGLVFLPSSMVALNYFRRRRGLALGIVMSGGAFGGMIFPPILRCLIPHRGLNGTIRVTVYIIFITLLIAIGLLIIPTRTDREKLPLPHVQLAKYSTDMCYVFAGIGTCLAMLVLFFPSLYLELLGLERGADPITSFNSGIVLSITGIIGGIFLGFVSDLYGIWNVMIPVAGGLALTLFTMCAVQGPKSLVAHSIFYGFFSGAWLSLMITALSSLSPKAEEVGTRVGLVLTGSSTFALVSFALQDALLGTKFNWTAASVFSGFIFLGVTGLAYLSRTKLAAAKVMTSERKRYIKGILIL